MSIEKKQIIGYTVGCDCCDGICMHATNLAGITLGPTLLVFEKREDAEKESLKRGSSFVKEVFVNYDFDTAIKREGKNIGHDDGRTGTRTA